ncbi:hypothetical protein E5Q_02622 [Mixia osmundae IAM 14324]|uniref:Uncharacterized protein n=2 Tax=Mixia osmundae (strain CBS 9802 / IAM 14324 / JCM 22182 / KY 12970) TaxID=764103 RepID=G7DZF4_MIXOS|nr:hypothetical protein E5Q_02622 [Mixia osmundae IAM 14324]
MATAAAPAPIPTGMFLRDRARRHSATAPAQGVSPRLPVETTMPRPASASGDIRVRANQQLTGLLDDMRRRSQPTDTLTRLAARAIPRDLVCPMGFAQIALRVHEAGRFPGVFAMPPYLESQRPNELIVCLEIVELGALLKIAIGFQRARQNNDKDHFGICYVSHQNYDLSLVDGLRMILEAIDSTREFDHCQKISIFVPSRALLAVVRSAPWHLLPSTRRQTVILLTHTSDAEPNSLKKRIRVMAASPGNDSRELQNITRARVGDLIEQAHVH